MFVSINSVAFLRVTAAHCVRYKEDSNTRKKESFLILVGRYDLKKTERGGLDIGVSEIHIHPDWDKTDAWDADIAVLILAQSVGYSEYIQPVCLPTSSISEYADGFVVRISKMFTNSRVFNVRWSLRLDGANRRVLKRNSSHGKSS